LTEQFKNLKVRIFISADGLDNIYEFLVKMLQAVEDIRSSKTSTPSKSIHETQKQETIPDAFKYAMEQELYSLNKSSISPVTLSTGSSHWTSELKLYGINSESPFSFDKSCLDSVFEDYAYLFGSVDSVNQDKITSNSEQVPLEIRSLESLGFAITKLDDFSHMQVLLVKNKISNWTIIVHLVNSIIYEWQVLSPKTSNLNIDNILQGKSLEMVQFLQFS
jgi:hypothetical protein